MYTQEQRAAMTPHEREVAQEVIVRRYLERKALDDEIAAEAAAWPAWVLDRHAQHAPLPGHFAVCGDADCRSHHA